MSHLDTLNSSIRLAVAQRYDDVAVDHATFMSIRNALINDQSEDAEHLLSQLGTVSELIRLHVAQHILDYLKQF